MSSYLWWVLVTFSEISKALSQTVNTNMNLGSFFDGTRVSLFNPSLTGKSGIDRTFYWNNSKVEPVSLITDANLVERVNPVSFSSPITSANVVYADLNPSNGNLRVLFRFTQSPGPDLLGYLPDTSGLVTPITTPLTVNGNQTCTLFNNLAQMDPYVVGCYNDTMRQTSTLVNYLIWNNVSVCTDTWNSNAVVVCGGMSALYTITNTTICTGGSVCPNYYVCTADPTLSTTSCSVIQNCTDTGATCSAFPLWINSTATGTMSLMYCSGGGGCKISQNLQVCTSGGCNMVVNCTSPTGSCGMTNTILNYTNQNTSNVKICTGGNPCTSIIMCTIAGVCTTTSQCQNGCNTQTNYTNFVGVAPVRRLRLLESSSEFEEGEESDQNVPSFTPAVPKVAPYSPQRRVIQSPRVNVATTLVSTPANMTVITNISQWKLNIILANLTTPEYTFVPQTNDLVVDLNNTAILTNCVASLVPQESDNLTAFYVNNNVAAMFLIWEKPKLNTVITSTYNNSDIFLMIVYPNGTLGGGRLVYTAFSTINATTNLKLITDVRAVYESTEPLTGLGTTGVIHLIITGLLNFPDDNVTKMWDCWVDAQTYVYRGCVYMTGYQLDPLYPISNLLYNAQKQYELYFTSRGDPTLVSVSLYTRGATPNRNDTANIPHSLYPMHKLSTYQAGQTVNWGDPSPSNYTFSWNKYKGIYSYYAYSSNLIFNNYKSGLMFSDSGIYKFFKNNQTSLNYYYNSMTPNGVETLSLIYNHHNGTTQISNITLEIVNLTTFSDFSALGFSVQSTKCYKNRLCRMRLPGQPSVPRYGPHYSYIGYTNDAGSPRLLVLREAIALYYNNDGMASPMPPSIQYFFPGFAVFRASDSSMGFETTKCLIEKTAYTDQYICSSLGLPPALPYPKDFNSGDKVVIYYNTNGIYYETARPQASPAVGSYMITTRSPMNNQYFFSLSTNEVGPYSGGVIFNATIPVGSFYTWNSVANISSLCVVSNQAVTQLGFSSFVVKGCKNITTQPWKLTLSTNGATTFLSHISNITKRGFQFVRESVVMWMVGTPTYNVGNDSSVAVDYNELNFNSGVLIKAAYCSFGNSFALFSPSWKLILGKWNATDSVGRKAGFLSENIGIALNTTDIYAYKCISEWQSMVLISNNGTQVYLTILNLTDVTNPKYLIAAQQKLDETYTLGVNMDNSISYGDNQLFIRVSARTFIFKYDHFDLNFQVVDGVVGATGISYRVDISPYGQQKWQTFPINYTTVAENNTLDILSQWTFNLTSRNAIDTMLTLNGHVWDMSLIKPPYVGNMNLNMNSRIMKMPVINYRLDTSTLATFSSSMVYHSRFAFLGNITAVIKNFNSYSTYVEVKPNVVMAVDAVAWIAYLPYNCHDIALVGAAYPAFIAVLKCSSPTDTFLYGVQGTMTLNLNAGNFFHFTGVYNGPRNDPSILQASAAIVNPSTNFVTMLYNPQNGTAWKYAFRIPTTLSVNGTAPTLITKLAAYQLATNATSCVFTVSQKPSHVTVCVNLSSTYALIYTMDSFYSVPSYTAIGLPPAALPVTLACASNYTKLTASYATLRCIFSTNIEMYMVDMDEYQNYKFVNYSAGGALTTNASNPRVYSICIDYVPQGIAMTQHFIGVISKQTTTDLTTTYPTWGFHLFHIDSMNTVNFTNQTNINNQYAGLILPKGGGNNPFHFSSIYPFQASGIAINVVFDNTTNTTVNVSVPVHDNYFHLQDGTGNIYTYKADTYMLNANLNNTKLKSYMDSSVFSVDATAYPFSQVSAQQTVSSIFERRVIAAATTTVAATTSSVGDKAMNTVWITAAVAAAVALAAALYFMFRKKESTTKSLSTELRNESGILKL